MKQENIAAYAGMNNYRLVHARSSRIVESHQQRHRVYDSVTSQTDTYDTYCFVVETAPLQLHMPGQ
jgi:hypothetical protein